MSKDDMPKSTKLFQIAESDLQTLEVQIPRLIDRLYQQMNDPQLQVMAEELKTILSGVRWNYGPPTEVKITEVGGHGTDDGGA